MVNPKEEGERQCEAHRVPYEADPPGYGAAEVVPDIASEIRWWDEKGVPGFATPEEAALDSWRSCPSAQARVVRVTIADRTALVVIDTVPSHPDHVQCLRITDGWVVVGSSG